MKLLSVRKKVDYKIFNIQTYCKNTRVYLCLLGVRIFKLKEAFLCVKSQWQVEAEIRDQEWRDEQNAELGRWHRMKFSK